MAGRPPRAIKRIPVLLRFEPDELAAIDAARGEVPRTVWIIGRALGSAPGHTPPAQTERSIREPQVPNGALLRMPRAAPGSRLKKR